MNNSNFFQAHDMQLILLDEPLVHSNEEDGCIYTILIYTSQKMFSKEFTKKDKPTESNAGSLTTTYEVMYRIIVSQKTLDT